MLSECEKRTKTDQTNVVTRQRYCYVLWSCDHHLWRSSFSLIQTCLLFPVFNLWNYQFCRLILYTWCHFSSSVNILFRKFVFKNYWSFCSAESFTGKHMCQSLFLNKVAGRPAMLLKEKLWHRCFPVNFAKFLRTPLFTEHLRWLLLSLNFWYLCSFSSVILPNYIHCHKLFECAFLFGKWFIKVNWSLQKFAESVLLFVRKHLLFIILHLPLLNFNWCF